MALKYNNFPEFARTLETKIDAVVRKAAFDIETQAKQNAPILTGNLRASIYTVTYDGNSGYGASIAATSKIGATALFPALQPPPRGQAIVAVGAAYGIYVEMGSNGRSPVYYLTNAAVKVKPLMFVALESIFKRAGGS